MTVWAREVSCYRECLLKQVDTVATVRHVIIDEQLHDNIIPRLLTIGNVLTLLATSLTISFESLMKFRAIGAIVADCSSWTRVIDVVLARLCYLSTPQEGLNSLCTIEELDSFFYSRGPLLSDIPDIRTWHIYDLATEMTESLF